MLSRKQNSNSKNKFSVFKLCRKISFQASQVLSSPSAHLSVLFCFCFFFHKKIKIEGGGTSHTSSDIAGVQNTSLYRWNQMKICLCVSLFKSTVHFCLAWSGLESCVGHSLVEANENETKLVSNSKDLWILQPRVKPCLGVKPILSLSRVLSKFWGNFEPCLALSKFAEH